MTDRATAYAHLALTLRHVMHARYMSLHYVRRPWWKRSGPRWWLEDAVGHRYGEWPW